MPKGNTLADLRAAHDKTVVIPNRIKGALATLAASGNAWAYEHDFMKLAKPPIGGPDISRFREPFADYWAELPTTNGSKSVRRVWFATKKLADEWKGINGG